MPGYNPNYPQKIKFFNEGNDIKLEANPNFKGDGVSFAIKFNLIYHALLMLVVAMVMGYWVVKKALTKESPVVRRQRVYKPKYVHKSAPAILPVMPEPLVPRVIKHHEKEILAPIEKIEAQPKTLPQRKSDTAYKMITKSLSANALPIASPSAIRRDPVELTFPSGTYPFADLTQHRLMAESHDRHCPENTFVIFEEGDESVPSIVQAKSTQLAKRGKQGVIFHTQDEREKMHCDVKLKIFGSNGKGDQRYLGRLETTAIGGVSYGLLIFSRTPVSHAELERQQKHRN